MLIEHFACRGRSAVGLLLLALTSGIAVTTALPAADPSSPVGILRDARRVVFLGDSITYGGGWVADLAAWM